MQVISTSNVSLETVSSASHIQVSKISKPTLSQGSNHPDVVEMQNLLRRYVLPAVSSGTFDDLTDYTVRLFQYRMFLPEDGVVGTRTWLALYTGAPVNMPVLRLGSAGETVKAVQAALSATGYIVGPVDGQFGAVTLSAISEFQRYMGLASDGILGPSTWHALSKIRLEDPVTPIRRLVLLNDQKRHFEAITDIAVAPYGQLGGVVATASHDTTVRFWLFNGKSSGLVYQGDRGAVSSAAFYPAEQQIISATLGGTVRTASFSVKDKRADTVEIFPARGGSVQDLAVEPNGRYIATVTRDNAGRLFDFEGNLLRELFKIDTTDGFAESVAINPRLDQIAVATRNGGALLWNKPLVSNGNSINLSSSRTANLVRFSPNGYKLAVVRDTLLQIYANRRVVLTNHQFESNITAIAFNPTGRYLAVGSEDHKVYIFDLQANGGAGKVVFELAGHEAPVSAIAFGTSPARFLYSGDVSGRLLSWEVLKYNPDSQVQLMGEDISGQPKPF